MKKFISIQICIFLFVSALVAQTKERKLIFDDYKCDQPRSESKDEDSNCLIELKEVSIGNEKIVSGEVFEADENWLKNLKVKIKNVSSQSLIAVSIGFGLIEGLNEELAPSASWAWGFSLYKGQFSNTNDKKRKISKVVILKPNEEIELTYKNFPKDGIYNPYRSPSFEKVVRQWQKIVITTAILEFKNGEQKDSFLFIKKEQK